MFKIVPAGRGMSMLQSDPMPTADAEAKLEQLNAEEAPEEENNEEPMGEMAEALRLISLCKLSGGNAILLDLAVEG